MKNVNKVFLLGNVSRDPEIKKTTSSKKVAIFGIATNRDWNSNGGDKSSITEFHNCIAWGRLAELCEMYLAKGQLVYGEGYLKTRSWDDEAGKRQFRTEIVLIEIIILEKFSKKGEENRIMSASEKDELIDDNEEIIEDTKEVKKESEKEELSLDDTESTNVHEPLFEEEKE